jgi:hypothetical protein
MDSAICIRIDLPTYKPDMVDMVEMLLELEPWRCKHLQFCICADFIKAAPELTARISELGCAIDGFLSLKSMNPVGNIAIVEEKIIAIGNEYLDNQLSWWGIGTDGLNFNGSLVKSDLADLLMDHGVRWISPRYPHSSEAEGNQPGMLTDDLVHIPCFDLTDESGSIDFKAGGTGLEVYSLDITRTTYKYLATCLDEILSQDLPMLTLNEIADISLAYSQASYDAKERVSFQQYLTYRDYWDTEIGPDQQAYKIYDYRGGWRLKPGFYNLRNGVWNTLRTPDEKSGFSINRHGFRGPMHPHRKPDNEIRIVILGDSCVFGVAGDQGPWPAQVQLTVDKLAGPGRIRVINAGIEGQSSVHCLMRLDRILSFDPDIILVAVAANDLFIENPADYIDTTGFHYATPWEIIGEYPRERDILNSLGGRRRSMTLETFYPYSYDYHLREIVKKCQQAGVIPILMPLPGLLPADRTLANDSYLMKMHQPLFIPDGDTQSMRRLYEIYNYAVTIVAQEEGVDIIDGEAFIAENFDDQRADLFSDTCHPTLEGNRYIGKFVGEMLWKIIAKRLPYQARN